MSTPELLIAFASPVTEVEDRGLANLVSNPAFRLAGVVSLNNAISMN